MKLGEKVIFENGFEIEGVISQNKLTVKKGDTALVTRYGYKILRGEGRGKIISFMEDEKPNGIDCEGVADMIYERLNREYNVSEFLMDYDIDEEDFIDSIFDVISDIL